MVVVVVMLMLMLMLVCGVAGLVVTNEPKELILCWTQPLTRTPNLKSL